jgi:hypothetical protein
MKGLEPSTFCMASRRSSQLSYIRERSGSIAAALRGSFCFRIPPRSILSRGVRPRPHPRGRRHDRRRPRGGDAGGGRMACRGPLSRRRPRRGGAVERHSRRGRTDDRTSRPPPSARRRACVPDRDRRSRRCARARRPASRTRRGHELELGSLPDPVPPDRDDTDGDGSAGIDRDDLLPQPARQVAQRRAGRPREGRAPGPRGPPRVGSAGG